MDDRHLLGGSERGPWLVRSRVRSEWRSVIRRLNTMASKSNNVDEEQPKMEDNEKQNMFARWFEGKGCKCTTGRGEGGVEDV